MAAGQRKPEAQWIAVERKAANLDQCLKCLIMLVLPDDQMNSVINCLTAKSTWDDLILYHDGPCDVKQSRVTYLKLCYDTFKFKEAKSKRFFQRILKGSAVKETNQTECHKYGKKGHFARDYWSKTSVSSYQSPFQPKLLLSSGNKPKLRNTKDFKAKYNKVKAKLALLNSNTSAPSSFSSKNKGLNAESHAWDEEGVSLNDEETKVKALMTLTNKERIFVGKESAKNIEWTKITMKTNQHKSSQVKDSTLLNHDTDEVPLNKSQRNTTDPSVVASDSSGLDYDSADESLVCSTPFLPLKKLDVAKPSSGPKTVKSILKLKSTFKAKTLKGITLNEPSSAPTRGNKSSSAFKINSAPASKLKNVNVEDDPPLAMDHTSQGESSLRSRPKDPQIISQRRGINPKNPQHVIKNCEICGSSVHTTSDHNDIDWLMKQETPHAKKAKSSNALRSKTPIKRKPFTKSPNMYQEYLAEFWYSAKALENSKVSFLIPTGGIYEEVGLNTFRNVIGAHYISHSSKYVAPSSIDVVRKWFPTIGYGEEVSTKGTLRKSLLPPGGDKPVFKAPKTSLRAESVSQGAKPRAKTRHKKPETSSKQPSVSSKMATKGRSSKISQLKLILDYLLSMILYLHNKTKPNMLVRGLETVLTQPTIEKGSSSTVIHSDKKESSTAIHGDKEEASSTIKLEDLEKLVSQIQPSFNDLDSLKDDHVIIVDESDEDEPNAKTKDTLVLRCSSTGFSQNQELTNQVLIL
uniref:Retrovirus-related Pol polyprotein from transposon TNT 1-94 n=1 Tax=Tanacetum cinerariifolium TaxID=118510 RepID=A0A6L2JJD5_TANCI|nr:hypothetical protein [Tanacetum cinerariifolium]